MADPRYLRKFHERSSSIRWLSSTTTASRCLKVLKECSTLHCWVRAIHKSGSTRVACKQDP